MDNAVKAELLDRALYYAINSAGTAAWTDCYREYIQELREETPLNTAKQQDSTPPAMFDGIKKGDTVYSLRFGEGTVTDPCIHPESRHPIRVHFTDQDRSVLITASGKDDPEDVEPTYFWSKPEITLPPPPLPELEVDAHILVYSRTHRHWISRHFHSFGEDGTLRAWADGTTSITAIGPTHYTPWVEWKLP